LGSATRTENNHICITAQGDKVSKIYLAIASIYINATFPNVKTTGAAMYLGSLCRVATI